MKPLPCEKSLDSTLAFLSDPFRFISTRCRKHGTDVFETRIALRKTVCMVGDQAAQIFYDSACFTRKGAMPPRFQRTLFGKGGVQGLDGAAHRERKAMFTSVFSPNSVAELAHLSHGEWAAAAEEWPSRQKVALYDEARSVLLRAACRWAGISLTADEFSELQRDLTLLVDGAGAIGPRHWAARRARRRADTWLQTYIDRIRSGKVQPPVESAAWIIAWHREQGNQLLDLQTAAVELNNVLRPILAIAVFITFAAMALHAHPECEAKLQNRSDEYREWFVQEVRRYYPFFPVLIARVREDFEWQEYSFREGTPVLLELYGTNHDPEVWKRPDEFRPERFQWQSATPFNFIPQGGGNAATGHRCIGELATTELVKVAVRFLTNQISYDVPQQRLELNFKRVPPLPPDHFAIANVEPRRRAPVANKVSYECGR